MSEVVMMDYSRSIKDWTLGVLDDLRFAVLYDVRQEILSWSASDLKREQDNIRQWLKNGAMGRYQKIRKKYEMED